MGVKQLEKLFDATSGICAYCGCETYMMRRERNHAAMLRFGIPARVPGSARVLSYRLASLERVVRGTDGGTYDDENVVLACAFCNSHRGDASPEEYKAEMLALVAAGLHPNHQAEPSPVRMFRRAKLAPAVTATLLAA